MNKRLNIPFYPNLDDGLHCLQACLKMVLGYYFPDKEYSYEELDRISKHVEGKWTWQIASLLFFAREGFEVVNIENIDYEQFATQGDAYLKQLWSKEVFDTQSAYSDLKQEQELAQEALEDDRIVFINREATFTDVEKYFAENYIVLVSLNPCVLDEKDCYASHIVVVTKVTDSSVTFHDPGLPPQENREVAKEIFEKAMTPPAKEDTNVIALRKRD